MSQNGYEKQKNQKNKNSLLNISEDLKEQKNRFFIKDEKEFLYFTPAKKDKAPYIPETPKKQNRIKENDVLNFEGKNLTVIFESM